MLGSLPATISHRFLQIRFLHQRDRYLREKRDFESAMRIDSHVQFVQTSRLEVHGATQFTLLLSSRCCSVNLAAQAVGVLSRISWA